MHGTAHRLCFFGLLIALTSLAYGINYMYFSDIETSPFGDRIRFWGQDTLCGPVRTNAQFAIMQNPVFCDYFIQGADAPEHGPGYNPLFQFEVDPVYNAPVIPFPEQATWLREQAFEQGLFFNAGPDMQAWVQMMGSTMRIHWAELGEPFDTLDFQDVTLPDPAQVFFDAPFRISGTVSTVLMIGSSSRIGLEDNLLYASNEGPPQYRPISGHTEKLAVISENEIKILNTPANGRENSSNGQDIVLHGIYVALNGYFTFENHNVADSGYVCVPCGCQPGQPGQNPPSCGQGGLDERGIIYLWGSLMQHQRNYVHRSCCTGTGYNKKYRYDNDLKFWDIHLWSDTLRENTIHPTALQFGEVFVGDTAWLDITVSNDFVPVWLNHISILSGLGFFVPADSSAPAWEHHLWVGFAPLQPGLQIGEVTLEIPYYDNSYVIALEGTGSANAADEFIPHPSSFSLSVYPNPFNAVATLTYSLPAAGPVELKVMDILGREVQTVMSGMQTTGTHSVQFDASELTSGLYFAKLQSSKQVITQKLLLIK